MYIQQIIADKFYEFFEQELYEFTFTFKTEAQFNKQTIPKIYLLGRSVNLKENIELDAFMKEEQKCQQSFYV